LTKRALRFHSFHREALSWLLSTTWPTGVVLAVGSRQRLLLMGQLQARPKLLRSAVTTEAEALASVRLHQPQLLIITDWLESGSVVSCVQTALQEVPGLRVFMIVSQQEQPPELWALEPLLDAMVLESDLGCEEAPLMRAFRELTRGQRYRSPSLRAAKAAESARAAAAPAGAPLTPRETEVLELIGQGLKDRQVAEALGVSHETARTYVKTVRRKLGGGSRLAAVASRWGR
jgi:DNA-binding NarL/FixJ family response regulator